MRFDSLHSVESQDGMTANWMKLPCKILETLATRIINEVKGVNPDQDTGRAAASSTSPQAAGDDCVGAITSALADGAPP